VFAYNLVTWWQWHERHSASELMTLWRYKNMFIIIIVIIIKFK